MRSSGRVSSPQRTPTEDRTHAQPIRTLRLRGRFLSGIPSRRERRADRASGISERTVAVLHNRRNKDPGGGRLAGVFVSAVAVTFADARPGPPPAVEQRQAG